MRSARAGLVLLAAACGPIKPPVSAATLRAADLPADPAQLVRRAAELYDPRDPVALENVLVVCDRVLDTDPINFEAAWQAARAGFWLADAAGVDKDRKRYFAQRGARYGGIAVSADGARVEGHYYRGLALGYQAQTLSLGALELVKEIHQEARAALGIDERYDHAGPRRLLGGVLVHAPGWPTSVGDPDEGTEHLARAVELAADYPLNRLYYGEALLAIDRPAEAERQLLEARRLWQEGQHVWMKARLDAEAERLLVKARARIRR